MPGPGPPPVGPALCPVSEEDVRQQLRDKVFCLEVASPEMLDPIVGIWRGVLDRVYGLSVSAANGFFTFLRLSAGGQDDEDRDKERRMTAALRLLKLLANHIHELGHLLHEGFASTPTESWLSIIPQVFARLNHPSPGVRECLTGLVCRLAKDAPHRIVYPAVVGAACASSKSSPEGVSNGGETGSGNDGSGVGASTTGPGTRFLSAQDSPENLAEEDEEELGQGLPGDMDDVVKEVSEMENGKNEDAQDDPLLLNTFNSLMEAMSRDNPVLVSEVATFVDEMRRITVLWDELWLGTLSQHAEEMQKKMVQLQGEIKKVQEHEHLSEQSKKRLLQIIHDTYMKQVILSLEKIRFITSTTAETPHEEWFQEQFDETIADVIARLKSPADPSHPETAAQALKSLHQTLHQKSQARRRLIGQGQLDLAQISPRLAAIDSSMIPMPGEVKGGVCIREIQNAFFILPTKTKPKKLIFVGDNGQRYPYLFKGLEDLHLDERIMQFLGTVNAMFARLNRPPYSEMPRYYARHYAVTPLGPRSALIQMVQGATPLFPLYKKWQQREACAVAQRQQRTVGGNTNAALPPPTVLAPSELFFSKLKPALEAKGLHVGPEDSKILESRKDWPIGVLRNVLVELMRETPSDLLSQELWMSSLSSVDWWQSSQNYSRSLAVMSVIGYVIGLGDRHLDNVMVDLSNGDIVHIDYNVCFEKGKNLKVPETVPFRLTAVLRHALGPTGVEGMFRLSCERVLRTLRDHQDVLLTLLDAFVYDPLIDWTPGSESGYAGAHYGGRSDAAKNKFPTRRQLEREITQQFLGIRAIEMDHAWRAWQHDFLAVLQNMREPAERTARLADSIGSDSRRLKLYQEMLGYLQQLSSGPAGPEAPQPLVERYTQHCQREEKRRRVQQCLAGKLEEVEKWCERHGEALRSLRSDLLPALGAKMNRKSGSPLSAFHEPASDFLRNAGQAALVEEAGGTVVELNQLQDKRSLCLDNCLKVLNVYCVHTELCQEAALSDRYASLRQLLAPAVKDLSAGGCRGALDAYRKQFTQPSRDPDQAVIAMEERLRSRVSELSRRLAASIAERRQVPGGSGGPEDSFDFIYNNLFQTISVDLGASLKVAIADALHTMCRDWINLDERLMKGSPDASEADVALTSALNLDNDESASWFLYEESCFSVMLNQLAMFMTHVRIDVIAPTVSEANQICPRQVLEAFKLVRLLDDLSSRLRKLHTNFSNILMPEAVRILTGLSADSGDSGQPMECVLALAEAGGALIPGLEARMRSGFPGDEDPYLQQQAHAEMEELKLKVRRIRKDWYDLLEKMEKEKDVTGTLPQSQLLILAFYNEFNQMEQALSPLVQAFPVFFIPSDWYYVDSLTSAYNCLQPIWYSDDSVTVFIDLLFLKGLRVMGDVFRMCRRFSKGFHYPSDQQDNFDPDSDSPDMVRALVSHYLNFVWGGVLCGVGPSLCAFLMCALLEDARLSLSVVAAEQTRLYNGMTVPASNLLQMALDYRTQEHANLTVTQHVPPPWHDFAYLHGHVTSLVTTMNNVTQRQHTQLVMETCVKMVEGRLQRAQRALASFQWLHIDGLGRSEDLATPTRQSILMEMEKYTDVLKEHNDVIDNAAADMVSQHDRIVQRLKWTQGVNPSVSPILESVEESFKKNGDLLLDEKSDVQSVMTILQSVLHLETYRTRSKESEENDIKICQFLTDCADELQSVESGSPCEVTDLEKEIMKIKTELLGDADDGKHNWTEELIRQLTQRCGEVLTGLKDRKKLVRDQVRELVLFEGELKTSVGRHTRLLTTHDIRAVLKALGRFDDPQVKAYALEYRRFSTEFSTLLRLLSDLEKETLESAIVNIANQLAAHRGRLATLVEPLRRHLRRLAPSTIFESEESEEGEDPSALDCAGGDNDNGSSKNALLRSDEQQKTATANSKNSAQGLIQPRNAYAMTVWRRVQGKLTGRDGPASRGREPFSVEEQVEWIIKEATNVDNLALMYEGWTAWL